MELGLRDYQQECVDIINALDSGSYLVAVATGLGKTVIFSHIQRRGRMLILSHREELVWQPKKYFDCTFGVEQAAHHSDGEEVVSASVQSLIRRLDAFPPDAFDIIITDEAHHAVAESYRKIYAHFKPRLHIGFTATPNRADNVKLGEIYSSIIFERNLKWGIRHEYLSNIRCMQVDVGYDLSGVNKLGDDLNQAQLSNAVDRSFQNEAVAQAYEELAVGQTLIFASSVQHAEHLAELIDGAVVVSADTDNRNEIIERFTNREIPCLVNCMVFSEGTDMPLIETVMIARPTRNASLYTQMVGRGLRLHPDKKELHLIDCVGVTGKLDICTAPDLFGLDKLPKEVTEERMQGKLITEIEEMVEEEMHKPPDWKINMQLIDLFEKSGKYDTHDVHYVMMPDGSMNCTPDSNHLIHVQGEDMIGNSKAELFCGKVLQWATNCAPMQEVLDFVYQRLVCDFQRNKALWDLNIVKRWGALPASDSQMRYLKKLARKNKRTDIPVNNLTKYEASILIGQLV